MVRPRKPEGESRDKLMQVRLLPREYMAFKEAADAAGLELSEWVRECLVRAAKRESPNAKQYLKPK